MEAVEELKKWIEALSVSEKRFIKLLGKARAGNAESQQLELFDWINKAENKEPLPTNAKFRNNLPTVTIRLKDLILDGLRLLNKEINTEALLRTTIDEIAILYDKKLFHVAFKQVKRAKKAANESCRYALALLCIEWEQRIIQALAPSNFRIQLQSLRAEEVEWMKKLGEQQELRFRHDELVGNVRQFSIPRNQETLQRVREATAGEVVERVSRTGGYVERALAVNILCIRDIVDGNPKAAMLRYKFLLEEWRLQPVWQADQAQLLLLICSYYQKACFNSLVDWEDLQLHLSLIPDFKALSSEVGIDFQRLLYHNRFILSLNTGNFIAVASLILEIDQWLAQQAAYLTETQILPFLYNLAIAEFLQGHYSSANRFVQRILNTPSRKVREDIRDFALVLQAILHFEMGDQSLNEYLTRAGKRHFAKHSREMEFELGVFAFLEKAIRAESPAKVEASLATLLQELERLSEQLPGTVPILGLNEVRIWVQAKQTSRPLKVVFLQAVKENLEALV